MNPLQAGILALFTIGIMFAPWRRPDRMTPRLALLAEAAALAAAVVVAHLAAGLVEPTGTGWRWGRWLVYGAAYWYAVAGGIGIVQLVLAQVPVRERPAPDGLRVPEGELARGRLIGILERALVLTLVLLGQFGALGLVVAAKAIARFRGLEDRDFAEYFLIGTLASLLHAVLVGVGLQLLH
jgi:hypothetical protein